jgi:hypothetical protein
MSTLMKASHQWSTRPDDERYTSLVDMRDHFTSERDHSRQVVVPSKTITLVPNEDHKGISIRGDKGVDYTPSHWSFGQLSQLSESPAGYLRTLPSDIAADAINFKLKFVRAVEDVGLLLYKNGTSELKSANGPNYGRVWNADVTDALVKRFGDGITGDWRVPGEFGKAIQVTKANTTLYAGDRDMFVFLADEKNRIMAPNRREGKSGTMARGFYVWNSEVGKCTLGLGTFLFDYVCCNRMIWGAEMFAEVRVRHTASAPIKWLDEVQPVLEAYANGSAKPVEDAIAAAQSKKVDDVEEFLAERFSKRLVSQISKIHEVEEGRPIETLWDVSTAVTAYARGLGHQDARVELERQAGEVMRLAA